MFINMRVIVLYMCAIVVFTAGAHSHTSHTQKRQPPRKQLQEDLGNKLRDASDCLQHALGTYSNTLQNVYRIADAQRIGQYIDHISRDLRTSMEYFEQLVTGDPALSRDALAQRIQDVERMITTWNSYNVE